MHSLPDHAMVCQLQQQTWPALQAIYDGIAELSAIIQTIRTNLAQLGQGDGLVNEVADLARHAHDRMQWLLAQMASPAGAAPSLPGPQADFLVRIGHGVAGLEQLHHQCNALNDQLTDTRRSLFHLADLVLTVAGQTRGLGHGLAQPLTRMIRDNASNTLSYLDKIDNLLQGCCHQLDQTMAQLADKQAFVGQLLAATREMAEAMCEIEYNTVNLAGLARLAACSDDDKDSLAV